MADPLAPPERTGHGQALPTLERIAPRPPARIVDLEIEARTNAGDVVLELHGRGGWVARSAVDRVRRAFVIESTALFGLVAEVVLRPPDVRHFDAAFNGMAIDRRGDAGLRQILNGAFASRCAACGGSVVVDEFIWDTESGLPVRKSYRCSHCRDGRSDARPVPVDDEDVRRALDHDATYARAALRPRFPLPSADDTLPDQLLDLYTARSLVGIASILERIESDLRAPSLQAGLRLGLIHVLLPGSRLNGYPGRVVGLRIAAGRVRPPTWRQWRERNVWQLFDEGCRQVRAFVQRLEGVASAGSTVRVGTDLAALLDGAANVALRYGMPRGPETFGPPPPPAGADGWRPGRPQRGIRLAVAQPPIHWTPESLGFAYLATSVAMGHDGAETLPLEAVFGPLPKTEWGADASALRRSLTAVAPVLTDDARVLLILDPTGAEGLVAAVVGAVGAGFRLADASLLEHEGSVSGHLSLEPAGRPEGSTSATGGAAPFALATVALAVTQIAVAVLRLRGEPTRFERLLGEVLIGLDRLGHLSRLVGTRTHEPAPAPSAAGASGAVVGLFGEVSPPAARTGEGGTLAGGGRARDGGEPGGPGRDAPPGTDPVRLTLELVLGELRQPHNPRLVEVEPGRWWLRDRADLAEVEPPLSERVEWAVFSLLSTSGGITEAALLERVARMFRGPDTPDDELVRACLASYRLGPPREGPMRTAESLQERFGQHSAVLGMLVEFAHRAGLRAWVARREQRRPWRGQPLGALLSDVEQRAYLPLVVPGEAEALEAIDCIWYVRGQASFLFDIEWMAALDEPVRRRGPRIPTSESLVRFLVIPSERTELVRLRLARSPLLRERMAEDNWHILTWENVPRLLASEPADLDALAPLLGLDPEVAPTGEQLALFA